MAWGGHGSTIGTRGVVGGLVRTWGKKVSKRHVLAGRHRPVRTWEKGMHASCTVAGENDDGDMLTSLKESEPFTCWKWQTDW